MVIGSKSLCVVFIFLFGATCLLQSSCVGDSEDKSQAHELLEDTKTIGQAVLARAPSCASGAESLHQYALKCEDAIGVKMPGFDCDVGGTDTPNQGTASYSDFGSCDAPNVLNTVCDPGSRFHVIRRAETNNDDIDIVGHCRKKGLAYAQYGDIAMIAYNRRNGAVCFFQALQQGMDPPLPGKVVAPADATTSGDTMATTYFPWVTPAQTVGGGCINCHDNGPFIRSPYLAQLSGGFNSTTGVWWSSDNSVTRDANYLPGTSTPEAYQWNKNSPYKYIGLDFQQCESYSIESGTDPTCTSCHRMGLGRCKTPSQGIGTPFGGGTSLDYGARATAHTQTRKNAHSQSSPIWMQPHGVLYDSSNESSAATIKTCAVSSEPVLTGGIKAPGSPPCTATKFAQGDSCNTFTDNVIDGQQKSDITTSTGGTTITVSEVCVSGQDCPHGLVYWTSLHGPFYQSTASSVSSTSPSFRGSSVRVFPSGSQWVVQTQLNAGPLRVGQPSPGVPGGTFQAISYARISTIPRPQKCAVTTFSITDVDGTHAGTSSLIGPSARLNILSSFLGNVSRSSASTLVINDHLVPIFVPGSGTVYVPDGNKQLIQNHGVPSSLPAWFYSDGYSTSCPDVDLGTNGWDASQHYASQNVLSTGDVQLMAEANADKSICFISGLVGDWSQTWPDTNVVGSSIQTYAQIYRRTSGGWRLKVYPNPQEASALGKTAVAAYGTCLSIDP